MTIDLIIIYVYIKYILKNHLYFLYKGVTGVKRL